MKCSSLTECVIKILSQLSARTSMRKCYVFKIAAACIHSQELQRHWRVEARSSHTRMHCNPIYFALLSLHLCRALTHEVRHRQTCPRISSVSSLCPLGYFLRSLSNRPGRSAYGAIKVFVFALIPWDNNGRGAPERHRSRLKERGQIMLGAWNLKKRYNVLNFQYHCAVFTQESR